ncbi:uncharacterized protein LOC143265399 [Megachile rotundata]|uniref:uncharacterized protein LOC143265399 n=1 Tax=Megachile rotundata TaxID=143995 RepID=UPI003FD051B4
MENLKQIATIECKIKTASAASIKALHRFVFDNEGDRANRKRLREFGGFTFADGSAEHVTKLTQVNALTFGDLVSCCNTLGLDYSGSREDLIRKVCSALMDINSLVTITENNEDVTEDEDAIDHHDDQNEEENEDIEDIDGMSVASNRSIRRNNQERRRKPVEFAMNYRDVEDSIRSFDGSSSYPVERWITDFEDVAILFEWTELEKLVFAKKSLKGLAKLYIQNEGVKTWAKLKELLRDEFSTKMNSAELHNLLSQRKMRRNETVQEYYLIMKEIASRGTIENDALIQYIIDGIPDETSNKLILFGTRKLSDFKERLKVYETLRKKNREAPVRVREESTRRTDFGGRGDYSRKTPFQKNENATTSRVESRCYNCGEKGYLSRDCARKSLGKKCFECKCFGHTAAECTKKEGGKPTTIPQVTPTVNTISTSTRHEMRKEIFINDVRVKALIDTGSCVSLLREDVYKKIGIGNLHACTTKLTGFGKGNETLPLGYVQITIKIDSEEFPTTVYVVPIDSMNAEGVIGTDIINLAELTINQQNIIFHKIPLCTFLTQISTDNNLLDLTHVQDDEKPIYQRPRRLSMLERDILQKQIDEWLQNRIIEPYASEYASSVVIVKKKDGSSRVCIDYRKLNKIVEKDRFPLPLTEELLDRLQNARIFCTIDLKNAFFHITVDENSRKFTSFITHFGQYQFIKMPFGLSNAPAVFQRFINDVFRELVVQGVVLIYIDDIIIPTIDEVECLRRLKLVLQTASDYGLNLNLKKCKWMHTRIEFLGHHIENGKIYPSEEKVKAVVHFPEPKSIKDVQSFLGLSGYFRKFISHYSIIAKPLSDLLRKDKPFEFNNLQKTAFNQLKEVLCQSPVLKIYDPKSETELHTDASKDGFGAVLMQRSSDDEQLHPVYYMSLKTKRKEIIAVTNLKPLPL